MFRQLKAIHLQIAQNENMIKIKKKVKYEFFSIIMMSFCASLSTHLE